MDPVDFFYSVARGLVDNRCFASVQPGLVDGSGKPVSAGEAFPAIVFHVLSAETLSTMTGPYATGLTLRYEVRSLDHDEGLALSGQVLTLLRRGGRLVRIGAGLDDYDEQLKVYRRIQSVTVSR